MLNRFKQHQFLFEELVKRDFKKKYKRTILGMFWSVLSPLLTLLVMSLVFTQFFGRTIPHYTIYLFAGTVIFHYFSDSTNTGMASLIGNAGIFTKVNVPKYLFLFSQNVSTLINFGLTLLVFFIFVAIDGLPFTWKYFLLVYPVVCLVMFNIGCSLVLSALFLFFRDMQYLWGVLTRLIMYLSAIMYDIQAFPLQTQYLFYFNPIYVYIYYFRKIVIENTVPVGWVHLLAGFYALAILGAGLWIYKKYNHKFLYYV